MTLTNTTATPFVAGKHVLSYHWTLPNGSDATPGNRLETALPADLAPGASVTLDAKVAAPALADIGNEREQFMLRWDVYDRQAWKWLSETAGVPTLDQDVRVEKPTSDQLGLEKFYQYGGVATGAGGNLSVNQYSGNAVWSYDALTNPSRGLASFVRSNYNSSDTSDSYTGYGWSVTASTLNRLGTPLEFGGLLPGILGWPSTVTLVDGDGTSHLFELNKHDSLDSKKWTYDSPAGVHLYLQYLPDGKEDRRWVFTTPERTQFFFDGQGYHTATVEKNGNTMSFTYERALLGNRNTGVLQHVTDATGRRTLTLDYYQQGDVFSYFLGDKKLTGTNLDNLFIIDQLKSITDVSGRVLNFTYSDKGHLQEVVDGAGNPDAKTFTFFYDKDGTKLNRVVDPNGHSTSVEYFTDSGDPLRKWNVRTVRDRRNAPMSYDYVDPDGNTGSTIDGSLTDGNGHTTRVLMDGYGRPERLTDAKQQASNLHWDEDNNVIRMVENNGATTSWVYDQKTGLPLEIRDAEANRQNWPPTKLGYRTTMDGYVADLTEKTTPEGRKWVFVYDDRGNLLSVTDPKGTVTADPSDYTSRYSYDEFGHLIDQADANGHTTRFADYDANGFPQLITDALNCSSRYRYDDVGNVLSTVDAKGKQSSYTYDIFKRPLDSTVPKDQAASSYIVTPGPRYDANDNVVTSTAANGALTRTLYDEMDQQVGIYAPKDTPDGPEKLTTFTYDPVGQLIKQTEPKGMLTSGDDKDFSYTFRYDEIGQLVEAVDVNGNRNTAQYDDVGNLVKEVDARKNKTADPTDFTTRYVFDANHQVLETIDAENHASKTRYDRDGNVVASIDEEGNETLITLDERAMQTEVRSPHSADGGGIRYFSTRYEYDQVGNLTRTINPRGVDTPSEVNDFVSETVYDELNRPREEILPYDPADAEHKTAVSTIYTYDELGQVAEISAPPSHGETTRNITKQTYFDNGWVRSSTDSWDLETTYDYTATGQQSNRTVTSAGGASQRVQTWEYYPDGKLKTRADDGVPVGKNVVLVDNSNAIRTQATPGFRAADSPQGFQGTQYRAADTRAPGENFMWKAGIPADGDYEVLVRYPQATATDASYSVEHDGGASTVTVDQTQRAGEWVSLGKYAFTAGQTKAITLSGQANGTVAADAVQLVRDNSADADDEKKTFGHTYDANDNLTKLTDSTPGSPVDTYDITYDEVNLAAKVKEIKGGAVEHTTDYDYDENDNLTFAKFDGKSSAYEYNTRDLVSKITNKKDDADAGKVTTFAYTKRGHVERQVKGNGNTVDFTYYLDGLVKRQLEKKKNSETVVNDHQLDYDANSNRTRDNGKKQNADDNGATVDTDAAYTYDPRDRVRKVTKNGTDGERTEEYKTDDNGNVWDQTIDGTHTSFDYDRNRLISTNTDGQTANYDYDAFGKLAKVTQSGKEIEKYTYDGFDRKIEHVKDQGTGPKTTKYTYDPLDREQTRTENAGGDGEKTTALHYLGMSEQVLTEDVDGKLRKAYQYSADGEMLGQIRYKDDGSEEDAFLGFNPHSDVEQVTGADGNATATYGYTAYGKDDEKEFTGEDKPDPANPDKEQQNSYRFNTARHDKATGTYDMGFRDYSPGLNRFLTLDLYNGALADLGMSTDPWTNNRYTFGAGNPLSQVEIDGHGWFDDAMDWVGDNAKELGHAALDVAGLVPVVGEAADLANAAWYAAEGDYANAALSAAAAVPFAGYAASAVKAGKYAVKGAEAVQGAGKAADSAGAAKTASKATDAGANGAKTAPAPKPAPKAGGASNGKPSGAGGGKAGGTASTGKQASGSGSGGGKAANGGGASATKGTCNSFVPGTSVLMADGTYRPIEDVREGDAVLAADPDTGRTEAKAVVGLITGQGDKTLVRLTVDTDGDAGTATGTVVATDGHPFWVDDEGRWVDAGNLEPGSSVRTVGGNRLTVLDTRSWIEADQRVHNLTIDGIHTYFVSAGSRDLLVHNAGESCKLAANMKDAAARGDTGAARPPGAKMEAHHIVPHGSNNPAAKRAQAKLDKFGIDINEAANGVYLPKHGRAAAAAGSSRTTHNQTFRQSYMNYIDDKLAAARSRKQVYAILSDIRAELIGGRQFALKN
ncbi:golvesin C-terminal-like domain-containing protein [Amycolatopsis magusensis]|uniref:RHS repeat-associated protein n=1 Tax=Amycolatopsis magusensis TaxID=882444 RepID=A0ABS4PWL0_9PSEU|nr:polymorphic toxin-type HINT domain-containing protein [Amycolatopsis magusensis]MBP2183817.1 RHS repeat-associated protein [Amycolatopsis magusensis]